MLITWALAIVMGLVGAALVAYLIVSLFVISGLERVGIPFETAHFFVCFPVVFGGYDATSGYVCFRCLKDGAASRTLT